MTLLFGRKTIMQHSPQIPLCQSEFLQDISIELGRRFAASHPFRSFSAEVDTCEHHGESLERLTVWASTYCGTAVCLALWADGTVWVGVILRAAKNNEEYSIGFYPRRDGLTPERFAEAFRDTVSVSTRLCYSESPLPTLRQIWNHSGEVQTTGTLNTPHKSRSGALSGGSGALPENPPRTV